MSASVKCYVVEPVGAAVLSGATDPNGPQASHPIQGGGYSMATLDMLSTPSSASSSSSSSTATTATGTTAAAEDDDDEEGGFFLRAAPDGYLSIDGDTATQTTRLLAKHEGIFSGFSGGANVAAAVKLLRNGAAHEGQVVACVICDSGLKYLSTDLWEE